MVGYGYHGIAPYLLDLGTSRRAGYSRMKDIIYEGFDRAQVDTVFDTLQKGLSGVGRRLRSLRTSARSGCCAGGLSKWRWGLV
jgi:hypothetical protein